MKCSHENAKHIEYINIFPTHLASKYNHICMYFKSSRSIHSLSAGPIESNKDRSGVFSFDSSKIAPHVESSSDSEKCKSTPPIACRQSSNSSVGEEKYDHSIKICVFLKEQSFANSNKRKQSSEMPSQALAFRPSAAFLLGCPLALVLIQRKLTEGKLICRSYRILAFNYKRNSYGNEF
jgi:hypothetical protein